MFSAEKILQTQDSKRYHMQIVPQACQCVLEIHAPTHQKKNILYILFSNSKRKKGSITSGFRNADSDRSERHADSSSQFRSE